MSRRFTNTSVLACFVITTALAWPCWADNKKDARKKFGDGVELVKEEKYSSALAAFEEAYRLYPNGTSLINIAMCLKELGRYVESIAAFDRFLAEEGDKVDEKKRQIAEEAIREMTQLAARLEIQGAPPGAKMAITADETLETVDPEATADHETEPVSTPNQTPPSEPTTPAKDSGRERVSGMFAGGVVATGLGVAAGALGIAFNIKGNRDFKNAKTLNQQADESWSEGDTGRGEELDGKYNNYRTDVLPVDRAWMIAGYTAAGVSLVTGIVLFVIDAKEKEKTKVAISPASGGLELRF
ncbi:MAG: hypothetical protein GY854_29225 [Deltaproteobacteria bacterium]|nr:hypothetical protein [Deltaproteobacteria bacterium]